MHTNGPNLLYVNTNESSVMRYTFIQHIILLKNYKKCRI